MKHRWHFLLVLVALGLSACTVSETPRSCEEISQTSLRSSMQLATSPAQIPALIGERFGVSPSDVSIRPARDGSDVRWTSNGVSYELIVQSGQITLARVSYERAAPPGQKVLECLGVPEKYWAYYYPMPTLTHRLTQLNLFYPAIGAACWIDKYGNGERPPGFSPNDTIAACDFVPIGPAGQVIPQLLHDLAGPSAASALEQRLEPWPGVWQEIVVDTRPLP